jgi:hypothetical protein
LMHRAPTVELDNVAEPVTDKILPSTTSPGSTKFTIKRGTPGQAETPWYHPATRRPNFPDGSCHRACLREGTSRMPPRSYCSRRRCWRLACPRRRGLRSRVPTAGRYELYRL